MKVCIVTVHKSLNSGSYLQAIALERVMREKGINVYFLKTSMLENIVNCLIIAIKKAVKLKINDCKSALALIFNFCRAQKHIREINPQKNKDIDCFVIGSDTLWNFADAGFNKYKKRYLCLDFDKTRLVTYAVSAGNADYETFYNDETIVKGIKKIDAISVRDAYTKELVDKITGKESALVLDPTLLLSREDFAQMEGNCSNEGYILIYMFEKLSEEMKKSLIDLKEKTGKKIVSFGGYRAFADVNVSNDPFKFLYYFNHADMVITDTFHGTIFSIINRKPFAEFGGHKKKVSELLSMLELNGQICEKAEDMEKIINKKIDYDKVEEKLNVLREQSKDYLFNALKG